MTAVARRPASVLAAAVATAALLAASPSSPDRAAGLGEAFEALSIGFVPNRGQAPDAVRFHTYASSPAVAFTARETLVQLDGRDAPVRLRFVGAATAPTIDAAREAGTRVSYVLGADPARWVSGLPSYGEVVYRDLWPGVDLAFAGDASGVKYEARVAPGGDPGRIRLSYPDARRLSLDGAGNLRIHMGTRVLTEGAPRTYQLVGGRRASVASRFVLHGRRAFGFALGTYDASLPLVIDPALHYSTFLGGSVTDSAEALAVDPEGNAYVTGSTTSANFPVTTGPPFRGSTFSSDGFVAKLSPGGDRLVYATFFGGTSFDRGTSIGVDAAGSAYVAGETGSGNFPTTPGAYDRTFGSFQDPFALKLSPDGSSLVYATYLGGSGSEGWVNGTLGDDGSFYVVGSTSAADIVPAGVPAYQRTKNGGTDGFVQRLSPEGSSLLYATYLGGSSGEAVTALALAAGGRMYLTGWSSSGDLPTTTGALDRTYNGPFGCCTFGDAYVVALDGASLAYGTYLGSRAGEQPEAIAVGPGVPENVYVTGRTESLTCCTNFFSDFPVTPGAFDTTFSGIADSFLARIDPYATGASQLVWSTFLGGSRTDGAQAVVVDAGGDAYVGGWTFSDDFPATPGSAATTSPLTFVGFAAWTSWLTADGRRLRWSSLLDGPDGPGFGDELTFGIVGGGEGALYAAGRTSSAGFPTTPWSYDPTWNGGNFGDAFIVKLATTPQAQLDLLAFEVTRAEAAGSLASGQAGALRATLDAAKRAVNRGDARSAVGDLRTFIGRVNDAARTGPLAAPDALLFMDEATEVILFVEFWLEGVGGPGPGPAPGALHEPVATVDVLVPEELELAPGETLAVGAEGVAAEGVAAGCTPAADAEPVLRRVEVGAAGAARSFDAIVLGDAGDATRVENLTSLGTCSAAGRGYTVFRGNPVK